MREIKNYIYGKPREVLDIAKPYVHSGGFHCPWWGFRIVHSGNRWFVIDEVQCESWKCFGKVCNQLNRDLSVPYERAFNSIQKVKGGVRVNEAN